MAHEYEVTFLNEENEVVDNDLEAGVAFCDVRVDTETHSIKETEMWLNAEHDGEWEFLEELVENENTIGYTFHRC